MGNVESIGPYLEPIRKSVSVRHRPQDAFEIFTAGIARWWPLSKYSIGQQRARTCAVEPRVGGEVYEVLDDGQRCPWGTLLVWEPPHRFVMSWYPGRPPQSAQQVEVRFVAEGEGTRVELEHRDWAKLGERAAEARNSYEGGWAVVLGERFAEACAV